jgi:hypothetical protein
MITGQGGAEVSRADFSAPCLFLALVLACPHRRKTRLNDYSPLQNAKNN